MNPRTIRPAVLGFLVLVLAVGVSVTACGKKAQPPATMEEINQPTVAAVMGTGGTMQSGVTEAAKAEDILQIKYHLYVPEKKDIDEMIGADLAPKIQQLYKTFKTINRVTIVVETSDQASPYERQPYCAVELTRKIYEQTNWTTLLAKDLFKVCKITYLVRELKKSP